MNELNLMTWFGKRQLDFCPKHFIKVSTSVDDNSIKWIQDRLTGRFYITDEGFFYHSVYFEDPQEAILFELTWS